MGWWPFKKKSKPIHDDPHVKGTRLWIQELRDVCERNYDNFTEGQRVVRQMQIEWIDANREGVVDNLLLEGLDRRAFRLLRADSKEWLVWLDNEDFWKPGWRGDIE
ncbi:MAG: hypothetical protein CXT72_01090 [Methanobacteriota archaeon]|jgi:hypothetical protein|nr:MAG: hypothetical protein CXT72_01090 [Euryarchaeota archaeon]HIL00165.1 hypothetical protein [Candidatus Poseidoniales archaeon]